METIEIDLKKYAKQHLSFLRKLHQSGIPFHDITHRSLERYTQCWLPLLLRQANNTNNLGKTDWSDDDPTTAVRPKIVLIPPMDVAWIWHCHRLAPTVYARYCKKHFGTILEASKPFQAHSSNNREKKKSSYAPTEVIWFAQYPNEPFHFNNSSSVPGLRTASADEIRYVLDGYALDKSSKAQSTFLWQVAPAFKNYFSWEDAIQDLSQIFKITK